MCARLLLQNRPPILDTDPSAILRFAPAVHLAAAPLPANQLRSVAERRLVVQLQAATVPAAGVVHQNFAADEHPDFVAEQLNFGVEQLDSGSEPANFPGLLTDVEGTQPQ